MQAGLMELWRRKVWKGGGRGGIGRHGAASGVVAGLPPSPSLPPRMGRSLSPSRERMRCWPCTRAPGASRASPSSWPPEPSSRGPSSRGQRLPPKSSSMQRGWRRSWKSWRRTRWWEIGELGLEGGEGLLCIDPSCLCSGQGRGGACIQPRGQRPWLRYHPPSTLPAEACWEACRGERSPGQC